MLTWDVCSKSTTGVYVCKHTIVLMQGGSEEACKRQAQQEQRKKQREIDLITAKLALDTKRACAGTSSWARSSCRALQSSAGTRPRWLQYRTSAVRMRCAAF